MLGLAQGLLNSSSPSAVGASLDTHEPQLPPLLGVTCLWWGVEGGTVALESSGLMGTSLLRVRPGGAAGAMPVCGGAGAVSARVCEGPRDACPCVCEGLCDPSPRTPHSGSPCPAVPLPPRLPHAPHARSRSRPRRAARRERPPPGGPGASRRAGSQWARGLGGGRGIKGSAPRGARSRLTWRRKERDRYRSRH